VDCACSGFCGHRRACRHGRFEHLRIRRRGYSAGTDFSITTNGPAVLGTRYSTNPGATDLFVNGIDEGAILGVEWEPSPFFFGTSTLEMYLFTALDLVDGPTITGTQVS
jgi:hypothetical protein